MKLQRWMTVALAAAMVGGSGQAGAQAKQAGSARAQPEAGAAGSAMRLNVVLGGAAAAGLTAADATLLENDVPVPVQSLQPLSDGGAPTHMILVIDDVNAPLQTIAFARSELKKFFAKNDGRLRAPISIAVMTDTKTDIQPGFSQNGAEVNAALQKYPIGLHTVRRDAQYAGFDRANISVRALGQLVQYAASIPGHKLLVFVSPGWPLLSGPRIDLPSRDEKEIFASIARLQESIVRSDVTLDMVNPFGPSEGPLRADYYQAFLKGVKKFQDVDIADLSLQVLATHSGGTVQQGSSDIDRMVEQTLDDVGHSYTLTFVPGPGEGDAPLHTLKLKVNRPGVTVRMPDEYYAPLPTVEGSSH